MRLVGWAMVIIETPDRISTIRGRPKEWLSSSCHLCGVDTTTGEVLRTSPILGANVVGGECCITTLSGSRYIVTGPPMFTYLKSLSGAPTTWSSGSICDHVKSVLLSV